VRLAVLASGTGTILEAILAAGLPVAVVLADRPCRALEVAEAAGVPTELVLRTDFTAAFDRPAYTDQVLAVLEPHAVDVVALAGYMTILSPGFFDRYDGRVLNTHPALLPAFKGAHAVRDALAAGVAVTGCTVHVATPELDSGPVLAQREVPVLAGDDEASLHERIKQAERELYPATLRAVLAGEGGPAIHEGEGKPR
jgi:phosphoribosylglycinamide formyltransferase-1